MRKSEKRYRGPLIVMEKSVFETNEYRRLSPLATKILVNVHLSYDGRNNGKLSFTADEAKARFINSKSTCRKALDELIGAGWIAITRQGGKNQPTLYSLTYIHLDYPDGVRRIDPAKSPANLWRDGNEQLREMRQTTSGRHPARTLASRRGFAQKRTQEGPIGTTPLAGHA